MFNEAVNEIKPYFNSHNDIYELFKDIADNASLQYVLIGNDILTVDDMESYNILTSDKDWMKKMFHEVKLKLVQKRE